MEKIKRNKRNPFGKKVKLLLFVGDLILYIENPKNATRKLLELSKKFSGHRTKTQKYVAFLHTNKERIRNRN